MIVSILASMGISLSHCRLDVDVMPILYNLASRKLLRATAARATMPALSLFKMSQKRDSRAEAPQSLGFLKWASIVGYSCPAPVLVNVVFYSDSRRGLTCSIEVIE